MSIVAVLEIALRPDNAVRALSILEGELDVTRTLRRLRERCDQVFQSVREAQPHGRAIRLAAHNHLLPRTLMTGLR
jgi:hypothetical protein